MTLQKYKSALLLSCLSLSIAGCGSIFDGSVVSSGYTTNQKEAEQTFFKMPSGYKMTKHHVKHPTETVTKDQQKDIMTEIQTAEHGWSQVAFDLALAIDEEVGLETRQISMITDGSEVYLAKSLDHYLRQNLRDLDYKIVAKGESDYHLDLYIAPLGGRSEFIPAQKGEMDYREMGKLNEGGETVVYKAKPKNSQEIQIDTILEKGANIISKTRSAHLLTFQSSSGI